MRIRDLYGKGQLAFSFEVFPPKTPDGNDILQHTLNGLAKYRPAFISCTYGAGGITRQETIDWCVKVQNHYGIMPVAHFTCFGSNRSEVSEWLSLAQKHEIYNIMALRGDPTEEQKTALPSKNRFRFANELVSLIRKEFPDIGIGVAGYPEKHPEASDSRTDLENLKRKIEAGADAVYTQLFFDNTVFLKFRDQCQRLGLKVPIIPGIMPVTEYDRIKRITSLCGTKFPRELENMFEKSRNNKEVQFEIGVDHAIQQCQSLIEAGVPGIHFFVLNRSKACDRIFTALQLHSPGFVATCPKS